MEQSPEVLISTVTPDSRPLPRLRLLVELEPGYRVFFRNLADTVLFRSAPIVAITSEPALFWRDVFVYSGAPWWSLLESMLWHLLAIVAVLGLSRDWGPRKPTFTQRSAQRPYITYTPTFTVPGSAVPRAKARAKGQGGGLARRAAINVLRESAHGIVAPPSVRMAPSGMPRIPGSTSVVPAMPLSVTGSPRLTVPAGLAAAVAPAAGVPGGASRRTMAGPGVAAVAPPPNVPGSMRKVGDVNIGQSEVVQPSPRLPMYAQRAGPGGTQLTEEGGTSVVPPPPAVRRPGILGGGNGNSLSGGGGTSIVPPPPSISGPGISPGAGGGRGNALSGSGTQVVPPTPSIQGMGGSTGSGGHGGSMAGTGTQVVPPTPSLQGMGGSSSGAGSRGGGSLAGGGTQVVPPSPSLQGMGGSGGGGGRGGSLAGAGGGSGVVGPPPSVEGSGGYGGIGRGSSLSGDGMQVVPPPPSIQGAGDSAGAGGAGFSPGEGIGGAEPPPASQRAAVSGPGGPGPAAAAPPITTAQPPAAETPHGPTTEEMPVHLIGLALALPGSSYFSSYEVFIAERKAAKEGAQLIKLVYEFLPYQRRLSELGMQEMTVRKLRVKRDRACDETLQQMLQPEAGQGRGESRVPTLPADWSGFSRDVTLPCYRTTADDYRKALSRH